MTNETSNLIDDQNRSQPILFKWTHRLLASLLCWRVLQMSLIQPAGKSQWTHQHICNDVNICVVWSGKPDWRCGFFIPLGTSHATQRSHIFCKHKVLNEYPILDRQVPVNLGGGESSVSSLWKTSVTRTVFVVRCHLLFPGHRLSSLDFLLPGRIKHLYQSNAPLREDPFCFS